MYLQELEKRRPNNPDIPKFTVDDNIADIEHEYNRRSTSDTESEMVALMKEGLKLLCQGIEVGNNKVGPFLKLHRWSDVVCHDVDKKDSRYDEPLCNIYRLYFSGRGRMNPIVQLGMLLLGSMLMHHMKKSMCPNWEPKTGTTPAPGPPAPPATPYNFPPTQFQAPAPPKPAGVGRPTFPKPPLI